MAPVPTKPEDFHETIRLHKEAFVRKGLSAAWSRVIVVVVQPGVEFGAMNVYPYRRKPAKELMQALHAYPSLVFEGHSTDYQQEQRYASGSNINNHLTQWILNINSYLFIASVFATRTRYFFTSLTFFQEKVMLLPSAVSAIFPGANCSMGAKVFCFSI